MHQVQQQETLDLKMCWDVEEYPQNFVVMLLYAPNCFEIIKDDKIINGIKNTSALPRKDFLLIIFLQSRYPRAQTYTGWLCLLIWMTRNNQE